MDLYFLTRPWLSPAAYERRVARALEAALARAQSQPPRPFNLATERWIILSDQHKGARNRADDFVRCERAYNAALAYYYRLGHTLVALGDAEELWKESPGVVLNHYAHTVQLEAEFHRAGRYLRLWGNHDDDWSDPENVAWLLEPAYGAPLTVHESLLLDVRDGADSLGLLFLTHGHQGDPPADQWARLARLGVRYIWRTLQRLTGISNNTPAKDWQLRQRHNIALYNWARAKSKLVLVAGHTHRPVFRSQTYMEQVRGVLSELEARLQAVPDDGRLRQLVGNFAAELEWARAQDFQAPGDEGEVMPMHKPCYFNTGCCSFVDGDISGLELADGQIRLVRWPDQYGRARPKVLASAGLREVLAAC
ncbi:MAG: hypothetical protein JNK29_19830 [Anaerolineales bacterium]|nr:hypothetical protein [Anaerolineales bacterium]